MYHISQWNFVKPGTCTLRLMKSRVCKLRVMKPGWCKFRAMKPRICTLYTFCCMEYVNFIAWSLNYILQVHMHILPWNLHYLCGPEGLCSCVCMYSTHIQNVSSTKRLLTNVSSTKRLRNKTSPCNKTSPNKTSPRQNVSGNNLCGGWWQHYVLYICTYNKSARKFNWRNLPMSTSMSTSMSLSVSICPCPRPRPCPCLCPSAQVHVHGQGHGRGRGHGQICPVKFSRIYYTYVHSVHVRSCHVLNYCKVLLVRQPGYLSHKRLLFVVLQLVIIAQSSQTFLFMYI
jgi:hypothetical protein